MTAHWGIEDPAACRRHGGSAAARVQPSVPGDRRTAASLHQPAARIPEWTGASTAARFHRHDRDRGSGNHVMRALHLRRCTVLLACLGSMLLAPSALIAQEQPPDVRDIAAALVDERARIAELKAELDRRSAVLEDLTRRLESLVRSPRRQPLSDSDPASGCCLATAAFRVLRRVQGAIRNVATGLSGLHWLSQPPAWPAAAALRRAKGGSRRTSRRSSASASARSTIPTRSM